MSSKGTDSVVADSTTPQQSPNEDRPNELFHNIGSVDFLGFSFSGKGYDAQLKEAVAATGKFCAVTCEIRSFAVRRRRCVVPKSSFPVSALLAFSSGMKHCPHIDLNTYESFVFELGPRSFHFPIAPVSRLFFFDRPLVPPLNSRPVPDLCLTIQFAF
jgi:hypothetical protein